MMVQKLAWEGFQRYGSQDHYRMPVAAPPPVYGPLRPGAFLLLFIHAAG